MPPIGLILFFRVEIRSHLAVTFWLFAFVVIAESLTVDSARALAKLVKSKRVDAIILSSLTWSKAICTGI